MLEKIFTWLLKIDGYYYDPAIHAIKAPTPKKTPQKEPTPDPPPKNTVTGFYGGKTFVNTTDKKGRDWQHITSSNTGNRQGTWELTKDDKIEIAGHKYFKSFVDINAVYEKAETVKAAWHLCYTPKQIFREIDKNPTLKNIPAKYIEVFCTCFKRVLENQNTPTPVT